MGCSQKYKRRIHMFKWHFLTFRVWHLYNYIIIYTCTWYSITYGLHNDTRVYFELFYKCSVLYFLCNLRFNYKDIRMNSDSILKVESDLELKWLGHSVGCVSV